jgi:hypothetical protein
MDPEIAALIGIGAIVILLLIIMGHIGGANTLAEKTLDVLEEIRDELKANGKIKN